MEKFLIFEKNLNYDVLVHPVAENTINRALIFENDVVKWNYIANNLFNLTDEGNLKDPKAEIENAPNFKIIFKSSKDVNITAALPSGRNYLNSNFAVSRSGTNEFNYEYKFWWIASIMRTSTDANPTYNISLTLDYYWTYGPQNLFSVHKQCLIENGHIRQFDINGNPIDDIYSNPLINGGEGFEIDEKNMLPVSQNTISSNHLYTAIVKGISEGTVQFPNQDQWFFNTLRDWCNQPTLSTQMTKNDNPTDEEAVLTSYTDFDPVYEEKNVHLVDQKLGTYVYFAPSLSPFITWTHSVFNETTLRVDNYKFNILVYINHAQLDFSNQVDIFFQSHVNNTDTRIVSNSTTLLPFAFWEWLYMGDYLQNTTSSDYNVVSPNIEVLVVLSTIEENDYIKYELVVEFNPISKTDFTPLLTKWRLNGVNKNYWSFSSLSYYPYLYLNEATSDMQGEYSFKQLMELNPNEITDTERFDISLPFEPKNILKMKTAPFSYYTIVGSTKTSFEIDLQYIQGNQKIVQLEFITALDPGFWNYQIKLNTRYNDMVNQGGANQSLYNATGNIDLIAEAVGTYSFPTLLNEYNENATTNKYRLQQNLVNLRQNRNMGIASSVLGNVGKMATGGLGGFIGGAVGGAMGVVGTMNHYAQGVANQHAQIADWKNTPNKFEGVGNTLISDAKTKNIVPQLIKWELQEPLKNTIINHFNQFGYVIGQLKCINDFIIGEHVQYWFNYIKASGVFFVINYQLSLSIKQAIDADHASGIEYRYIREDFYRSDGVEIVSNKFNDYTKNNIDLTVADTSNLPH